VVADTQVLDVLNERATQPKITEQPFQTSTKRMTTLHRKADGQHFAALKGAPAVVLDSCSNYIDAAGNTVILDNVAIARFTAANEQMAKRALRVLALAVKHFTDDAEHTSDEALESGYTFLGLVGMIDPPRPGVANAISRARTAGIRTVMLTGDQLHTGIAIARELGLGEDEPRALHAHALLGAEQTRLAELARDTDVFARVSPEEKLRIVEALQQAGEVVAVTGDGVNDAPALKRANIGIAMGQRGTEVAKEAADIVLADDNFETIVRAVEGGRTIYANIIKFVHMMFSHNLGEVLMIFSAIAAGWPLPLLPLQILWMNLVTDVFPALALALEPASTELMSQPPRSARTSLLSRPFLILIGWQSVLLAAIGLGAYLWALQLYGPGAQSQTVALFSLVAVQLGHTFNCRSRSRSAFDGIFRNPFLWLAVFMVVALQLLAAYCSPLAGILGTVKPSTTDWMVICSSGLLTIAVVEVAKVVFRYKRARVFSLQLRSISQ
jgi:Ca2+-transporting ATPase